jgi:hypothetical protein
MMPICIFCLLGPTTDSPGVSSNITVSLVDYSTTSSMVALSRRVLVTVTGNSKTALSSGRIPMLK